MTLLSMPLSSLELLADNDVVFLKKSAIVSRSRFVGTIADYNVFKLTLVNSSGKKLEIKSARISHIQTEITASQQKAVQWFGEKKFELAFDEFAKALKQRKANLGSTRDRGPTSPLSSSRRQNHRCN